MQSNRSILGERAASEPATRVEMCDRVAVNERSVASCKAVARVLHGRGKRVPVNRVRHRRFGRWDSRLEVVGFQISIAGECGDAARSISGQAHPAMNDEGQAGGSVRSFNERRPLLDVVRSQCEAHGRGRRQGPGRRYFRRVSGEMEGVDLEFIARSAIQTFDWAEQRNLVRLLMLWRRQSEVQARFRIADGTDPKHVDGSTGIGNKIQAVQRKSFGT